eukprot:12922750-Prorocentrum_lima.AAC.1
MRLVSCGWNPQRETVTGFALLSNFRQICLSVIPCWYPISRRDLPSLMLNARGASFSPHIAFERSRISREPSSSSMPGSFRRIQTSPDGKSN